MTPSDPSPLPHRPEIDGLRAVAVLPVILFHASPVLAPGGFLGVDVFFVISGFLITQILVQDAAGGHFSYAAFYERRIRRLLPALVVVLAATLPAALVWLPPDALRDHAAAIVATLAFGSNVLFWAEADYFAPDAALRPLLHTWSLAVEEQFYLLYPPLLVWLWRRGGRRGLARGLWAVGAASFVLCLWGAGAAPEAAFYLAPFRAWELMAGALAALHLPARARGGLALLGLALILAGFVLLHEGLRLPSALTLLPVTGTVLVLVHARRGTRAAALLSLPPFVAIGAISYSAYLWHQPLMVFARQQGEGLPLMLAMAALSLGLAGLTWAWVEQPFRRRGPARLLPVRRRLFRAAGAAVACLAALAVTIEVAGGFPGRLTEAQRIVLASARFARAEPYREGLCFLDERQGAADLAPLCTEGARNLLIGDSHAASIWSGFAPEDRMAQVTASGCPPLRYRDAGDRPACAAIQDRMIAAAAALRPERIVLLANWPAYGPEAPLRDALGAMIVALRAAAPEARIEVLGGLPQWEPTLPRRLLRFGQTLDAPGATPDSDRDRIRTLDRALARAAEAAGAAFLSPLDVLCDGTACRSVVPIPQPAAPPAFAPLAWDRAHLTGAGAAFLVARLWPQRPTGSGLLAAPAASN